MIPKLSIALPPSGWKSYPFKHLKTRLSLQVTHDMSCKSCLRPSHSLRPAQSRRPPSHHCCRYWCAGLSSWTVDTLYDCQLCSPRQWHINNKVDSYKRLWSSLVPRLFPFLFFVGARGEPGNEAIFEVFSAWQFSRSHNIVHQFCAYNFVHGHCRLVTKNRQSTYFDSLRSHWNVNMMLWMLAFIF